MTLRSAAARRGLTLMEVLVSLAIFLLSLVALGRLVTFAGERALEAQYRSHATLLCQSKLAEVQGGALPLSSQGETADEDDPDYLWSIDAEQGQVSNLWTVTVRASRKGKAGASVEVALTQMILDPSVVGSTQDSVPVNSSQNNNAASGSTGSTGSTGSSTGM